jgi:DNA mismatch endonuclease (patch repair protein)
LKKSPEAVSAQMRSIRKKDTKPEIAVRRLAHRMGYRFRLHRRDLPGTPDIAFPSRKKVVFVHGCFWHQHDCALGRRIPTVNSQYWLPKLARNRTRDFEAERALHRLGWSTLTLWECEIRDTVATANRLSRFLGTPM